MDCLGRKSAPWNESEREIHPLEVFPHHVQRLQPRHAAQAQQGLGRQGGAVAGAEVHVAEGGAAQLQLQQLREPLVAQLLLAEGLMARLARCVQPCLRITSVSLSQKSLRLTLVSCGSFMSRVRSCGFQLQSASSKRKQSRSWLTSLDWSTSCLMSGWRVSEVTRWRNTCRLQWLPRNSRNTNLSLQKNVRHAWNTSWEEFLLGL